MPITVTLASLTTPVFLARLWLLFAAVIVVYRGLTQSLTMDEAHAYHLYLNQKAEVLFQKYEANYHVLHTWATWLAVHKFGKSEAIVRLPSMVAGLFYLAGVYVLCKRVLSQNWRFLIGVILLSANPLLSDYLSAARGYGAALAFFVWAFSALLQQKTARAGLLLALSAACNFTFLIPSIASGAVYLSLQEPRTLGPRLARLVLPFAAVLAPIVALPLINGSLPDYYYGTTDLRTAINTLLSPSLTYRDPTNPPWTYAVQDATMPVLLIATIWITIFTFKRRALPPALASGSLLASLLAIIAAHQLGGILYPWARTGLYLIWLMLVSCVVLWEWTAQQPDRKIKWLSPLFGGTCTILAVLFLSQFDTRYYYEFREDARVNKMMAILRDRYPAQQACIGGSWRFDAVVNYYRLRYKLEWIEEMKRTGKPEAGCRFYLLEAADEPFLEQLHLRSLYRDPLSRVTLAELER